MSRLQRHSLWTLIGIAAIGLASYGAGLVSRPTGTSPTANATDVLLDWLKVTDQQRADLKGHDPAFAEDLKALRVKLQARRDELASALDDGLTPDSQIRDRLEAVIAADAAIERRVADYLLAVRQHLSTEQQRQLFGLCAEGVRKGGGGYGPGGGRGMGWGRGGPTTQSGATSPGGGRGPGWRRGGRGGPSTAPAPQP